jgi:hypothetical protein
MIRKTLTVMVIFCVASLGACGGGSSTATVSTVSLTGTVSAPSVASGNIASAAKGFSKAVVDSVAETGGHIYTLDGEDLGTFTTAADGTYAMDCDLDTLKGDDDTGTTWSEDVIMAADNGIETYANIDVVEGETTTVDLGTANTDTTLAAQALADKIAGWIGWGQAYSTSGFDPECIFIAQKALWEGSDISGEGMADDVGIIKETIMGFMAGGGDPTDYGFANQGDMMGAIMDGTIDDLGYWDDIAGVAGAYVDDEDILDFGSAFSGFDAMDNFFASSFVSDGAGETALNISGLGKAVGTNTTSVCDDLKTGTLTPGALVKPLMATDDANSFETAYGDSGGMAVYFGLLEQCMATSGGCADMEDNPGSYWGFMSGYGGDYSDIYSAAGEFDNSALEGSFLAAMACEGETWEEMEACAKGMYETVYTGAGGDWEQFMSGDGEFNSAEFDYYGGYYTSGVADGSYDPDSVSTDYYESTYTNGQTYEGGMDAVQMCVDSLEASGIYNYDPCYGSYNPEDAAGEGTPPSESEFNAMCESSCSMAPNPAECLATCLGSI